MLKDSKANSHLSKSLLRKLFSSCLKLWSMWDNTCFILWIFTKFIGSEIQNSYFRNQNSEVKNQNLGEFAFESLSILYMLKDSKANSHLSKSLLRKLFSSCLKLWSMWDNTCFILWIFTKFIGSEIQNSYSRIGTLKSKIRTWVSLLLNLWGHYICSKIRRQTHIFLSLYSESYFIVV